MFFVIYIYIYTRGIFLKYGIGREKVGEDLSRRWGGGRGLVPVIPIALGGYKYKI